MALAANRASPRHEVTIENTGERFGCNDGQAILVAMVALGRKGIPSGCHGGGCGVCKIRILSGRYRTAAMSREHISLQDERDGIVLACQTYPQTDIKLEVLGKMSKAVTAKRYGFV